MAERFHVIRHEYRVDPYVDLVDSLSTNVHNVEKDPGNCALFTLVTGFLFDGIRMGTYKGIDELALSAGDAMINAHSRKGQHDDNCLYKTISH